MKALVVGAGGQLGRALLRTTPAGAELVAFDRTELDITDRAAVERTIGESGADIVFNAAAYTAVDKAESEIDRARAINAEGVGYLATAAKAHGALFVHVSTDFVFSGDAGTPYTPETQTNPLGVYGLTKLEGEKAAGEESLIVRTAWIYDRDGQNFVNTMLRLMDERDMLSVVADQIGTPTLADDLAVALWKLAEAGETGVLHCTNSGVASWYDFAVAIQDEAVAAGRLARAIPVSPIRTVDYPTPARRPHYSVLDCSETYKRVGEPARHWRVGLRHVFNRAE